MEIRPAGTADVRAIAEVHVRTWQAAYTHVFPESFLASLSVERREAGWREILAYHHQQVVVADDGGHVIGFASVGPATEERSSGELSAIYVEPEAWDTGAGRALMVESLRRLRESGFGEAVLWVLDDNPRARRFYEAGGWRDDGGRKTEAIGGVSVTEVRYRIPLS